MAIFLAILIVIQVATCGAEEYDQDGDLIMTDAEDTSSATGLDLNSSAGDELSLGL